MTRLVLLVILGIVTAMYFPESREMILEKTRPAMTPLLRWQTNGEMEQIARDLSTYERENFGRLPNEHIWASWLEHRYSGDDPTRDAWGGLYTLRERGDSFYVTSRGADLTLGTADDIVISRERARVATRNGPAGRGGSRR